jgi:ATP-dependent exoDNAse (exonuclease V) beta subunit
MPFLWRVSERTCLEGVIDLALIDQTRSKWVILDWKTNRIAVDQIDELRAQYRPQIAAYSEAIARMTGMAVEAGIYSTSTGKFIAYDRAELAQEWQRLKNLSVKELADAVVPE